MRPNLLLIVAMTLPPLAAVSMLTGCDQKAPTAAPASAAKTDDHGHDHGPGGEHAAPQASAPGHGGPVIALGEQAIGSFTAKATRDAGQIVAGKDAPIDVTVTPAPGSTTTAVAVRFWIGTENAKGSVKARAAVEDPQGAPNRWHVHAEIPSPIPDGSRLWVEIEDDKGVTSIGSYELKM